MTNVQRTLDGYVQRGEIPGAVALLARGDEVTVCCAGAQDLDGGPPMARDTIFRVASITKPITAAAAMLLVDDGKIGLDQPITDWLPELASPMVVRSPASPLDDLVPAQRDLTLLDLLTSRPGWGFPSDFSLPAVQALFGVQKDGRKPHLFEPPAEWLRALALVPMVAQPGEAWLYGTGPDILGVLISRVAGQPLHEVCAERLFEPLGMVDTGFAVPVASRDRLAALYERDDSGTLREVDSRSTWEQLPAFESGGGGLLGTVDDWHRFARMLLAGGEHGGRQLLSQGAVRQMMTNHITAEQSATAALFLEGQGWGLGGSVDTVPTNAWNVPGRYGWNGGTGTTAHLIPSTGDVAILFTQMCVTSPTPVPLNLDFWRMAANG